MFLLHQSLNTSCNIYLYLGLLEQRYYSCSPFIRGIHCLKNKWRNPGWRRETRKTQTHYRRSSTGALCRLSYGSLGKCLWGTPFVREHGDRLKVGALTLRRHTLFAYTKIWLMMKCCERKILFQK
jgi:hypothetical protein